MSYLSNSFSRSVSRSFSPSRSPIIRQRVSRSPSVYASPVRSRSPERHLSRSVSPRRRSHAKDDHGLLDECQFDKLSELNQKQYNKTTRIRNLKLERTLASDLNTLYKEVCVSIFFLSRPLETGEKGLKRVFDALTL